MSESSEGSGPSSAASGMPCTLPEGEVAGELMSAWASTQMRPSGCCRLRSHAAVAAYYDRSITIVEQ